MRALTLLGPRQPAVVEVPDPRPNQAEVLLRIRACGICGSDLNAWRGVPGIDYPLSPGAPGHETFGEVLRLGADVTTLRVGDLVTGLVWNGFAELATARAEHLLKVPPVYHDAGLLGEPLACAMNVVRRAAIQPAERLAMVGFGYLAALIVQLLRGEERQEWIAVSRRADSRALAGRLGAAAAYDFAEIPSDAWDSFPVVIEAAGVQQSLDFATWLTAYAGRLVVAGYHADGPRTVNMQSWNWKGIDVVNAHERAPSAYLRGLREALAHIETRPFEPLVTHSWPLADATDAFCTAEQRPSGFVKGVIAP